MNILQGFRKELLIILGVLLLFCLSALVSVRGYEFRLDSDYDMAIPYYEYIASYIREHKTFPTLHPYIGTGTPILGNIISSDFNPLFMIPIILFGFDGGVRLVFVFVVLSAGVSMWVLFKSFPVSFFTRIWGSLLYALCGVITAKFAAGHTLFALTYPIWPLYFLFLLKERATRKHLLAIALILVYIFYSGDIYGLGFAMLIFITVQLYQIFIHRRNPVVVCMYMLQVAGIFIVLSLPRLLPFILFYAPKVTRFFPSTPSEGSVHIWVVPLSFIMPLRELFYDRPTIQRILGFHFNWYEYYAFITPLPFLFLWNLRQLWREKRVQIYLLIICIGALYVALKYPYSPFYWMYKFVPFLSIFHVPQRIIMVLVAPIIVICALCAELWLTQTKRKFLYFLTVGIFLTSIFWAYSESKKTFLYAFDNPHPEREELIRHLRDTDTDSYYVVTTACCLQTYLSRYGISHLNSYQGVRAKNTPSFINDNGTGFNFSMLMTIKPKYIIGKANEDFSSYGYTLFFANSAGRVWRIDIPTIVPKT